MIGIDVVAAAVTNALQFDSGMLIWPNVVIAVLCALLDAGKPNLVWLLRSRATIHYV